MDFSIFPHEKAKKKNERKWEAHEAKGSEIEKSK